MLYNNMLYNVIEMNSLKYLMNIYEITRKSIIINNFEFYRYYTKKL